MNTLINEVWKLRIWKDTRGQDFTEYALMAAFVVTMAVVISPEVGSQISTVFSKVGLQLDSISGGGGGTLGGGQS